MGSYTARGPGLSSGVPESASASPLGKSQYSSGGFRPKGGRGPMPTTASGRSRWTATVPPPERAAPPTSGTPDSAAENGGNSHRQELEIILSGLLADAGR